MLQHIRDYWTAYYYKLNDSIYLLRTNWLCPHTSLLWRKYVGDVTPVRLWVYIVLFRTIKSLATLSYLKKKMEFYMCIYQNYCTNLKCLLFKIWYLFLLFQSATPIYQHAIVMYYLYVIHVMFASLKTDLDSLVQIYPSHNKPMKKLCLPDWWKYVSGEE